MPKKRTFRVRIEYTVKGELEIEAASPEEAESLAHEEAVCPPQGCEIVDWDYKTIGKVE